MTGGENMAEKTFVNDSGATLQMTICVRQGDSPYLNSETVTFELLPGETKTVSYGDTNPFLNGIIFYTIFGVDLYSKVQFITALQTELDTLLNTNSVLTITEINTDYVLTGSNPANPSLDAFNAAQSPSEMQLALENPSLGIDLSIYNTLTVDQQLEVATTALNNRPVTGYLTVQDVQNALDTAINELVTPSNLYVQQGASGDGSLLDPFGTIEEGLAAVSPNGTINILAGTYPITSQINVTTEGITLKGEPGTILLLQANLIPLLITASNVTVEGLTITSDIPYTAEFIQVAGGNTRIIGNTIFGPEQQLPMSNWIVNRAIVSQGNIPNLLVSNNTMYSLRTGLYINSNVTGMIAENVIYNTKNTILIDGALIVIEGNSWGIPSNEFDIVLLAGTTTGPPYDNVTLLSTTNSNATISDQRI